MLSMLSINLVNTLNPELIIVGGKLAQNYPPLAETLQDKIRADLKRHIVKQTSKRPLIMPVILEV